MSFVTSASTEFVVNGRNFEVFVAPPAISTTRGWNSVGDLVLDLFERVSGGQEELFANNQVISGSDPNADVVTAPGASYSDVRQAMHITWAEAQRTGNTTNPDWLQRQFAREFGQGGVRLVSADPASGAGVFQAQISPTISAGRAIGTRTNGRTGIREGSISFLSNKHGQTADVASMLADKANGFLSLLENDKQWCLEIPALTRTKWKSLSPQESIDKIAGCGCVLMGIWIRFSMCPVAAEIVSRLLHGKRSKDEGTGYKFPPAVQRAQSKFLFRMAEVVAGSRNMDPIEFWNEHMDTPVTDTEIYAICKRFKFDIMIMQTGAYQSYLEMVHDERSGALVARADEIETYKRGIKDVRCMIRFTGRDKPRTKFDRRDGSSMFMVCSYISDASAHVDTVFDPNVEANILGKQYNKFVYDVTYDASDNTRADQGYFDKLITEVVPNKFIPKRMHCALEPLDIETAVKPDKVIMPVYINDHAEFGPLLARTVRAVAQLYEGEESGMDSDDECSQSSLERIPPSFYTAAVFIDGETVRRIADGLDMEENNISGMVYLYAAFVNEMKRAGLHNKLDFSAFDTTMSRSRSARILSKQLSMAVDDNNRIDCLSGFDDLSGFTIRLLNPIRGKTSNDRPFSPAFIIRVGTYSKEKIVNSRVFVKQSWVQDLIDKARINVAEDDTSKVDHPDKRTIAKQQAILAMERYGHVTNELLALSVSRKSLILALMNRKGYRGKPSAIADINRVFGTYAPVRDEIVHMYDPQIDEPVVPIGKLSNTPSATVGHWEMDANFFYSQVLAGRFERMMSLDFYGAPWVNGSPRRAVVHEMDYNNDEFIGSYEADFGYAWVEGIDFDKLRLHMGFTNLNSWWRFAQTNPDHVERRVPCASIIHITSYIVGILDDLKATYESGVHPWLFEMTTKEMWIHIQRSVFNIRYVYFYHPDDQREALKRVITYNRTDSWPKVSIDDRLRGIPVAGGIRAAKSNISKGFQSAYETCYGMLRKSEVYAKDENGNDVQQADRDVRARKDVKLDANRTIGLLKYGPYLGGVSTKSTKDVINLSKSSDGSLEVYTYQGIPFPKESLVQVCVRDLPNSDMVLSEMVYVTPVVLAGFPKSLRIDILEQARHAMDLFSLKSNAFMVKTDAVFFRDSDLEGVYEYVRGLFQGMFNDPGGEAVDADDIRHGVAECKTDGCRGGSFCMEHTPFMIDEHDMGSMMPVKFIWHAGFDDGIDGAAVSNAVQTDDMRRYETILKDNPTYRKLSPDGREQLAGSLSPLAPPLHVKASSLMPTLAEIAAEGGLMSSSRQSIGEDPTDFGGDRLMEHCHIYGEERGVFVGEEGEAQYCTVDNELRNMMYMDRLLQTIDKFEDEGFLMEGPPGAGKSYTVCEYIKREFRSVHKTAFFVATATHLTLAPYTPLVEYAKTADTTNGNVIEVSTVHSLIGVFSQMQEACANPSAWMNDRKNAFRSRFMRTVCNEKIEKSVIFIDEYEMLPLEMEEMILYLSGRPNTRVVLLGDKYQTAAFGRGIRCDGDVIRNVTGGRCIEFDLPFRKPEYEYNMTQREAVNGRPTLFLEPVLSDYTAISSRRSPLYTVEIDRIARAYHEAGTTGAFYRDPVVSLQNYKAIVVVTLDIMNRLEQLGHFSPGSDDIMPFCGNTHYGKDDKQTGLLGTVDTETDDACDEDHESSSRGGNFYAKFANHMVVDPESKKFLVGTRMMYTRGYCYRSVVAFIPKVRGTEEGKAEKQDPVRMGQVMKFHGMYTKSFKDAESPGYKRRKIHLTYGVFSLPTSSAGITKHVFITHREMQAYMYYPFCLYTEGVVGHTFDRYTMIQFSNSAHTDGHYASLKKGIEQVERVLGDKSWVTPICKTMNVAVSRLTAGNKLRIIEINEGKRYFWKTTLKSSAWHMLSPHEDQAEKTAYRRQLLEMRKMVIESTVMIRIAARLGALYQE
jgi:hypothetical protein